MTMPTSDSALPSSDLVAAVAGAARGDRTQIRAVFERARQRVEQRARDELRRQLDGDTGAGTGAPAAKLVPRPPPRLAPPRPVNIRLSNGRRMRVTMTPAPARHGDLAALSRVTADNDRRAFQALRRHGRALDELARCQAELDQRVASLEEQSDLALLGLLRRFGDVEQRLKTLAAAQGSTAATVGQQARELGSQAASAQLQKVTAAVTSAQVAAFGEKGNLFATRNLLLAGNQLLWSFIDPLLRLLGIDFGMSPSPIAWLAPLGSLGLGAVTVGRFQHVRFLADVTTMPAGATEQSVSLLPRIGPADRDAFARRTDVLVTARAVDATSSPPPPIGAPPPVTPPVPVAPPPAPVTQPQPHATVTAQPPDAGEMLFAEVQATVKNGTLLLTLGDSQDLPVRITWLVDTGLGGG
jgi:hypothetical protein